NLYIGQPQNFYVSSSHVLTVKGDQRGSDYNDWITVGLTGSGGVQVTLNDETAQFDPGAISSIDVIAGGGVNHVYIEATAAGVPVTINDVGGGSDTVNVGDAGLAGGLTNILGAVTVIGNGADYVNVNDVAVGSGETYDITTEWLIVTDATVLTRTD